jgi:hypothetical protein
MKKKTYLLKCDPEFFAQLDAAVADANCTRADFIRDAVILKLQHHQKTMRPFYQAMTRKRQLLETEIEMPVAPMFSDFSDETIETWQGNFEP